VIEHAPEGVAVVWDCGGHLPLEVASEIVAVGGRILATAAPSARVDVPLWRLYTRDVSVIGFVISRATVSDLADAADLINDMLGAGTLTARITDRLPLAQTAAAHERMEAGGIRGRLIVHPA
jgi:NADPH:quinone reductase-like Zn-dependent oxidoreductase